MKEKSGLRHSSETKIIPKTPKSIWIIIAIWLLAIGSLLGTYYFFNHKPRLDRAKITKMQAKLKTLTDEQKIRLKYFEGGLLESASGDFLIIDSSMQKSEMEQRGLSMRKIELVIDDPLLLERQMMVREASKKLNNAEKRCVIDRRAIILYRDGGYYLVYDPKIYQEYVMKYGTECKPCEENKKQKGGQTHEKMG